LKRLAAAACVAALAAAAEILIPGQPLYHLGWYNVALCALLVFVVVAGQKAARAAPGLRVRLGVLAVVLGAAAAGLAVVANGLFAPDDREVVGAPGQRVPVDALGVLSFPIPSDDPTMPVVVTLERPSHAPLKVGERSRDAGDFILRTSPRDVVEVTARDSRGNALTITQPAGSVFLSPVLLMEHRQTIAGMNLPFDSFNLPAMRRVVKAILFDPAQAALLLHDSGAYGQSAVLFAVDDENDRPLPHAIAMSAGGSAVSIGGVWLRAVVANYPKVEIVSAPNLAAVVIGTLLVLGGIVALFFPRDDRANVAHDDAARREFDAFERQNVDAHQARGSQIGGEADDNAPPAGFPERGGVE
jgi:hypothetical protein